jgi:putative transposase
MLLAHKIELRPTEEQRMYLAQSAGIRRFTYNALLAAYKDGDMKWSKKSANVLLKGLKSKFPWMCDVSARTSRNVIDDLDKAYQGFFRSVKQGKKPAYPKFKKKGAGDSFSIRERSKFKIEGRKLRIEKLKTKIDTRNKLRLNGTAKQCTVSFKGGLWWASILVDVEQTPWAKIDEDMRKPSIGVDFGIKEFAVLSDGTVFEANQPLKKQLKKLARLQKKFARQKIGSSRREITKRKISRLHYFVTCKRKAIINEFTNYLTRNYKRIVIEDLNISGMSKNHKLARAILDVGLYEARRQLEYKSHFRNCELVIANRWFASSKIVNCHGHKLKTLTLSDRTVTCPECNKTWDRDHNAAINLNNYSPDRFKRDLKMHKRAA